MRVVTSIMDGRTTVPQVVVSTEDDATYTDATTTVVTHHVIEPEHNLMALFHNNFNKSRSVSTSTPYVSRTIESNLQHSPSGEVPIMSLGYFKVTDDPHNDSCFKDTEPIDDKNAHLVHMESGSITHGFESDAICSTKVKSVSISNNFTVTSNDSMASYTITTKTLGTPNEDARCKKHLDQNYSIDSGHGSYDSGLPESLDGTSHLDTFDSHSFISSNNSYSTNVEQSQHSINSPQSPSSDDLCIQYSKTTESIITSKPPISRTVPISVVDKHRWTSTPQDKSDYKLKSTPVQSSSHHAWNEHSPILSPYQDQILKKMMSHFSPPEPDRLIGRKMGLDDVDILAELDARNISAVSTILAYIPTEDLCKICLVSQTWRTICYTDKRANIRRLTYLEKTNGKENPSTKGYAEVSKENLSHHAPAEQRHPLITRQVLGENSPTKEPPATPLDNFTKVRSVAKNLKNFESLKRCPRCQSPSRYSEAEERANCTTKSCKYDFCTRCLCDFHGASPCPSMITKRSKKNTVNSKKSKQRLRRL
ncbi:unnamed protein product [Owenia fusiformis]|uniref:Uncharacterized protein n=1 Tax=Owenia fusiformis TaxID=6347 RepID=A0A8J1US03_OWEFU|nr:unnamed protein product [Owenia fusiformis]